jgi:hypothetical protein
VEEVALQVILVHLVVREAVAADQTELPQLELVEQEHLDKDLLVVTVAIEELHQEEVSTIFQVAVAVQVRLEI